MTKQAELQDEVQMWVELAVHKFHAKDGAVILGECSEESVQAILKLITTHQKQLLEEVLSELPERKSEDTPTSKTFQEVYGHKTIIDKSAKAFNQALDQVSALIEKKKEISNEQYSPDR